MAIQVDSSLHAAVTMVVTPDPDNPGKTLLAQSPQGCLLERIEIQGFPAFLVQLDYPLDYASTSYECGTFGSVNPPTSPNLPIITALLHVTDKTKLLVLLPAYSNEPTPIVASFHLAILNFQANLEQLLPVQLVPSPV